MSGLPPPYSEATSTSPYPPATNPTAPPISEKGPYPPAHSGAYPPQGYAPQGETPYPPQPQGQPQQPYPAQQPTYPPQPQYPTQPQSYPTQPQSYPTQPQSYPTQQQSYPTQQQPYPQQQPAHYPQGYPQGYAPSGPGYPTAPISTKQPQPPPPPPAPAPSVTVVQSRNTFTGRSNSFIGVLICAGISVFFCFPLGIAALIVAFLAYSAYSDGDYPRAIGMTRIATSLSISAFVCGIIITVISLSLRYTIV